MTLRLSPGTVLNNTWIIDKFLGDGACASVYKVVAVKKSEDIDYDLAVKVCQLPKPNSKSKKDKVLQLFCNTLYHEQLLHRQLLLGYPYAPRLPEAFYGEDKTLMVRYMVMEKLDEDLVSFTNKHRTNSKANKSKSSSGTTGSVSNKDIGTIGLQILKGLQWLHEKNFLFVDVKPDNYMLKKGKVRFVDYGLVARYDSKLLKTSQPNTVQFEGTLNFASLWANEGNVMSKFDDVESMW